MLEGYMQSPGPPADESEGPGCLGVLLVEADLGLVRRAFWRAVSKEVPRV